MEDQQRNYRKIIFAAIVGIIAVVLFLAFNFYRTHGTLAVENIAKDAQYAILKTGDSASQTKVLSGTQHRLKEGSYTLSYKRNAGQVVQTFDINGFFKTTTVRLPSVTQRLVERVAAGTMPHVGEGPNQSVVSFKTDGLVSSLYSHLAGDPSGLGAGVKSIPIINPLIAINRNTLIGFSATNIDTNRMRLLNYDFATAQTTEVGGKDFDSGTQLIKPSVADSLTYGLYTGESDKGDLTIYEGAMPKQTFRNLQNVAEGEEAKAIGVSTGYTAIGYGKNFNGFDVHGDAENTEEKEPPVYLAKLYKNDTQQAVKTIAIGKTSTIASIQVTNNGEYVSVVDDTRIRIFDTQTGKERFNYDTSSVISPQWIDNDRMIFGAVDGGLFELNATQRYAVTLFTSEAINLSEFNVFNNRVRFSAFGKKAKLPDGYIAYLDRETSDNNALIQYLPYSDGSIKLTSLGDTIYAGLDTDFFGGADPLFHPVDNLSQDIKDKLGIYLSKNIPDYSSRYKLIYGENL